MHEKLCWSHCQSIMKWVFMLPCTQFKLMLSLSTDRICNQSPTQGPRGRAVLMKSEEKQKRIEPTSLQTFYYKFSAFFCNAWWVLTRITRSTVSTVSPLGALWSLIAKRKRMFLWAFSFHARQKKKKKINKRPTVEYGNAQTSKSYQHTLASPGGEVWAN